MTNIYALYDTETGNIIGHYDYNVHPDLFVKMEDQIIPDKNKLLRNAIKLTNDEWQLSIECKLKINTNTKKPELIKEKKLTKKQLYTNQLDDVLKKRQLRYKLESDSLKIEAEADAIINKTKVNYDKWIAKVKQIKKELPKPTL